MVFRSSRKSAPLDVGSSPERDSERAPRIVVPLEPLKELPGGSERIVLVDDNAILRRTLRRVLLRLGYQIDEYASATQAIAALSEAQPVELVFSDCDMPGLTGYQLALRLWKERPDVRVLLSSGRFTDSTRPVEASQSWPPFLPKPYALQTLAAKIREVIDGPIQEPHPNAAPWRQAHPAQSGQPMGPHLS